jgi:hypothetical protein
VGGHQWIAARKGDGRAPSAFDGAVGEFILPYRAVRTAEDPDGMVQAFLRATYEAVAELADWDRNALEVRPRLRVDLRAASQLVAASPTGKKRHSAASGACT